MAVLVILRRIALADLAAWLLGCLAARILHAHNLRAIDPALVDFGGDD